MYLFAILNGVITMKTFVNRASAIMVLLVLIFVIPDRANAQTTPTFHDPQVTLVKNLTGKIAFKYREQGVYSIYSMRANTDKPEVFLRYSSATQQSFRLLGISTDGQFLGIVQSHVDSVSWLMDTQRPIERAQVYMMPRLLSLDFKVNTPQAYPVFVYNTGTGISVNNPMTRENTALTIIKPREKGCDCNPRWSADYQSIFYLRNRTNKDGSTVTRIIRKNLDTYDEEVVTKTTTDYLVVSPNGKSLAFIEDKSLILFDLANNQRSILSVEDNAAHWLGYPAFSPDSRYLAYVANFNDPKIQKGDIYLLDLTTGKTLKWIEGECESLFWSRE